MKDSLEMKFNFIFNVHTNGFNDLKLHHEMTIPMKYLIMRIVYAHVIMCS